MLEVGLTMTWKKTLIHIPVVEQKTIFFEDPNLLYKLSKKKMEKSMLKKKKRKTKKKKKEHKVTRPDQDQAGNKFLESKLQGKLLQAPVNHKMLGAKQRRTRIAGAPPVRPAPHSTSMMARRTGTALAALPDNRATIIHRAASTFRETSAVAQMTQGAV